MELTFAFFAPFQATAGKYQLQHEKTQQALEKAQSDFDRLQEKSERAQNDTRRVSSSFLADRAPPPPLHALLLLCSFPA